MPDPLERLTRWLLAGVVGVRFVALALTLSVFDAVTLPFSWVMLVLPCAILAWRLARSTSRRADAIALVLALSVVAARLVILAVALARPSPEVSLAILPIAKVWAPTADALVFIAVVHGPRVGGSLRAHPIGLFCLGCVGIDLGWRGIAEVVFRGGGLFDPIPWAIRELGLVGLLLAGFAWKVDPGPASRGSWPLLAGAVAWTLALIAMPSAAALSVAALVSLLVWAYWLASTRRSDWPLSVVALLTASGAVGVAAWWATHPEGFGTWPDEVAMGFGASSAPRAVLDVTWMWGTTAAALLAAGFGWPGSGKARLVALLGAGVAGLIVAASHGQEPLLATGLGAAWIVAAIALALADVRREVDDGATS